MIFSRIGLFRDTWAPFGVAQAVLVRFNIDCILEVPNAFEIVELFE
jgi:hypothetical protein